MYVQHSCKLNYLLDCWPLQAPFQSAEIGSTAYFRKVFLSEPPLLPNSP